MKHAALRTQMKACLLYGAFKVAGVTTEAQRQAFGVMLYRWNNGTYHRPGEPDTTFRMINHQNILLLFIRVE